MASDKLFNFLIYENGKLVYSKFNFNFDLYSKDVNMVGSSKVDIFGNFIKRNESTLDKPTTLKPELKKYFNPITSLIQNYVSKYGVIHSVWLNYIGINYSVKFFEDNQFSLYPYEDILRIQDFIHTNNNQYSFTKYNFDFNSYAADFNIPENKLVVFTDFIYRNYKLSGSITHQGTVNYNITDGYVVLPEFQKYFFPIDLSIVDYLTTYSVTSHNSLSGRSLDSIDFSQYPAKNFDLPDFSLDKAKEHFLTYGQFEYRTLVFKENTTKAIQRARRNVCSVFLKTKIDSPLATGFLYADTDNNYYLITTYHLIEKFRDQRYLYAIFENDDTNNFAAQFRIIGYDTITDIMMAIYDPELNYNQLFNVDFSKQELLKINYSYRQTAGEKLYFIGNTGFNDNLSTVETVVMNENYSGGFMIGNSVETMPSSILLQFSANHGSSGAPVIKGDPNGSEPMEIVGMLIGALKEADSTLIAIDNYILLNVIYVIIQRWKLLLSIQAENNTNITDANSINRIDDFIKNGYPKSWLGISNQYNHPVLAATYKELSNLNYIGGLLVTNFIIGFNFRDEKFVYTSRELVDRNVVKTDGPLINTDMYKRFITNGSVPIVIKAITYYDKITNEMTKLIVGKFGQQQPYSKFVYSQQYISLFPSNNTGSNYYNIYNSEFAPIIIEYFYYDGMNWQSDTEAIGDNSSDWYVDYTDNIGNIYHQHKFEYPLILLPYFKEYSISKYALDNYSVDPRGMSRRSLDQYGMSEIPYIYRRSLDQYGMSELPYRPKTLDKYGMSEMPYISRRSLDQYGMADIPYFVKKSMNQKLINQLRKRKGLNEKSEFIPGDISGTFSDI
jgi:hypothetical protein